MIVLQKLLDIVMFVLGTVLLLVGIFGFGHDRVPTDFEGSHYAVAYFYDNTALLLIAVGGGLIALGFLRRSWRHGSK